MSRYVDKSVNIGEKLQKATELQLINWSIEIRAPGYIERRGDFESAITNLAATSNHSIENKGFIVEFPIFLHSEVIFGQFFSRFIDELQWNILCEWF